MRTYKRKLILTKCQELRLRQWIGVSRLVYNLGIEVKNETYKKTGRAPHKFELINQITAIRADFPWINDAPIGVLQNAIQRLDLAYIKFFKTFKSGGGFPKYATKKTHKSITFPNLIQILNEKKIKLPKIGVLKIFKDCAIIGIPKTATIKIEPTGFFITIQCENVPPRFVSDNQAIGLDMGLTKFCVDSNEGMINNPRHLAKYERQLRIENRSLARKKKGSNCWKKQAKKLALVHHKILNVRRDFLHKESTKIAKVNNVVYLEDLNVAAMSANRNLSKQILDSGWSTFRIMLSYKTMVIAINPAYTSQTCYVCSHIHKANRTSQSEFVCTKCGHIDHADINAAKILNAKAWR